ncbi:MAG: hypothetical protein ACRC37_00615 [Lentisphaeria bacterium]
MKLIIIFFLIIFSQIAPCELFDKKDKVDRSQLEMYKINSNDFVASAETIRLKMSAILMMHQIVPNINYLNDSNLDNLWIKYRSIYRNQNTLINILYLSDQSETLFNSISLNMYQQLYHKSGINWAQSACAEIMARILRRKKDYKNAQNICLSRLQNNFSSNLVLYGIFRELSLLPDKKAFIKSYPIVLKKLQQNQNKDYKWLIKTLYLYINFVDNSFTKINNTCLYYHLNHSLEKIFTPINFRKINNHFLEEKN